MKPVILVCLGHYLPGYKSGGPIQSIANLTAHLGDEFEFRILTRDRDKRDEGSYPQIRGGGWEPVGKGLVYYASPSELTLGRLAGIIRGTAHDALYLNSFFNPKFTTLPLLGRLLKLLPERPVLIAPRGEFSSGALSLKSWKKRPYAAACRLVGLYRGLHWQASTEDEAEDIRRSLRHLSRDARVAPDVHVAPNLPQPVHQGSAPSLMRPVGSPLRIVFLSRIARMKNLIFLLEVLSRVSSPVDLTIYGPIDDEGYWQDCLHRIRSLPPNVRTHYGGGLNPTQVVDEFARHDLFVLPTLGENFGHAIAEALLAGTPVLISDRTPWQDLEARGAGWIRSLEDEAGFRSVIEKLSSFSCDDRVQMRREVLSYAEHKFRDHEAVEANRALLSMVTARRRAHGPNLAASSL